MADETETITHSAIIDRGGGPAAFGRSIKIDQNRVKAWKRTNSIPGDYWNRVVDAGLASFRELADAAEARASLRGAA